MKSRKIIFTTVLSALVCFGLCQQLQSATDTPDPGAKPLSNTADGQAALLSITTGLYNSAFGFDAVLSNSDASFNTGLGAGTLLLNNAFENTAVGAGALLSNTTGEDNNAVGAFALFTNGDGTFNNAVGHSALQANVDGDENNAMGDEAMINNTTGSQNTAIGDDALHNNVDGNSNVAIGDEAGAGCVGCTKSIYIGAGVGPVGVNELHFIRIGDPTVTDYDTFIAGIKDRFVTAATASIVLVDANQKVGTIPLDAIGNKVPLSNLLGGQSQAMLNRKVEDLQATVAQLTQQLKEQAAQIQKVSAQLEVNKPAPTVVTNK